MVGFRDAMVFSLHLLYISFHIIVVREEFKEENPHVVNLYFIVNYICTFVQHSLYFIPFDVYNRNITIARS